MTPEELKKVIKRFGLSQREFGALIGMSQDKISRFCTGENSIPAFVAEHIESLEAMPYALLQEELQRARKP